MRRCSNINELYENRINTLQKIEVKIYTLKKWDGNFERFLLVTRSPPLFKFIILF